VRVRRAVAWGLAAFAVVVTLAGVVLILFGRQGDDDGPFAVLIPIVLLVFPLMGALIVSHRPGNLIGWLFCAFGFTGSIGGTAEAYATVSGSEWSNWVALITIDNPTMFTYFVFVLLLFPDGKLPSPRWRHLARFSIVTSALLWFFIAFKPGTFNGRGSVIELSMLGPIWKVVEPPLVFSRPLSLIAAAAVLTG
jgi:two-component system, NarL family, sensor kinase